MTMTSSGPHMTPSSHGSSGPVFWGILAILGGAILVLAQFVELDASMPWITLVLGVAMLLWGIFARSVSGLIPGGIVTGVGLGLTLITPARIDNSESAAGLFLMFLALGFVSIPLTTKFFADELHWWGFIPGGIIFLVGLATAFGGAFLQALNLVQLLSALALVALGGWLIFRYLRNKDAS